MTSAPANRSSHDPAPAVPGGRAHTPTRTALVLGGGGSAGNAWLIGVVAGMAEAGLAAQDADLLIGTSAGATAAAQLSSAPPADLLAQILGVGPQPARPQPGTDRAGTAARVAEQMERTAGIIAASHDLADMRRRIGAAAIELDDAGGGTWHDRWRATVAARLPGPDWPERALLLTAVDAATGDPVVLDRSSGVDLVDAVAASCSSGPAYRIGDRRFVDGGYRTNADNADLAAGFARVLVLSPFGGRSRTPASWGTHLAAQVQRLRADGSIVEVVVPDDVARAAFGDHAMDPASRPPAARAGHDQGVALAERLLADGWGRP